MPTYKVKTKLALLLMFFITSTGSIVARKSKHSGRFYRNSKALIGYSVKRKKIKVHRFGYSNRNIVLWIGGQHGNEWQSVKVLKKFIKYLKVHPRLYRKGPMHWVIPKMNPDGIRKKKRNNINDIDLNRNFNTANWQSDIYTNFGKASGRGGTIPFSEVEALVIKKMVERLPNRIVLVVNIHCCARVITSQTQSKLAKRLEKAFRRYAKYRTLKKSWDESAYPVTGSMTRWFWEVHNIPDVFIELDKHVKRPFRSLRKSFISMMKQKTLIKKGKRRRRKKT